MTIFVFTEKKKKNRNHDDVPFVVVFIKGMFFLTSGEQDLSAIKY